jgi:hypothetical protein
LRTQDRARGNNFLLIEKGRNDSPSYEGALKTLLKTFILKFEKNSPSWTDAFLFKKWIETSDEQSLSIVVNMGSSLIVVVS